MFYRRLLKLKEDTHSIIDLEVAHRYLHLLESTSTFHAQVLQWVFAKFGDSYTLLNVYNISENLELAHVHYEANTMKPIYVQGLSLHQLRQPNITFFFKG
jgi:hypothetical protein